MVFTFVETILNVILNFICIHRFGYNGATVATELVVGLLMISNVSKMQDISTELTDFSNR